MREWAARLVAMFRKRSMRERLDRELALHRELLVADLAARGSGSTPGREMGGASLRDAFDDQAGVPWLEHLWGDLRYAVRAMRRAPAFSLVVILTLALGIGVNTAIFSVVHGVLLKPLPYPDSERLVWLGEAAGEAAGISVTWPNFTSWRSENRSFEKMAAFQFGQLTLTGRGDARSIRGLIATPDMPVGSRREQALSLINEGRKDRGGQLLMGYHLRWAVAGACVAFGLFGLGVTALRAGRAATTTIGAIGSIVYVAYFLELSNVRSLVFSDERFAIGLAWLPNMALLFTSAAFWLCRHEADSRPHP